MAIPQKFLDDIKSSVNLPDLVGKYLKDLKKSSADTHKACCPFHSEKSPSFTISTKKGFYHCFGCGAHGDHIDFLMEHAGMRFMDAVEEVAGMAGMQVPKEQKPEKTEEKRKESQRFAKAYAAMKVAQSIFVSALSSDKAALEYLYKRGITDESIVRYELGYAPDEWHTITGNRSFTAEALADCGLSTTSEKSKRPYDRFRGRITIPIFNIKGNLIGFGGRGILGQDPKYLNSPDTMLFQKGNHLFGLKQAQEAIGKAKRVFVFEGYMDVIMAAQNGVQNVVASLGTSITEHQLKRLFTLSDHVTFCMDGDSAGRKAAWRAADIVLPLLDDTHKIDFMFMPDGQDPDDFTRANGGGAFLELAKKARTLTDFMLDVMVSKTDMKNGESLAKYLSKANAFADRVGNAIVKMAFQKRIAEMANISLDAMLDMLRHCKPEKDEGVKPAPAAAAPVQESAPANNLNPSLEISVSAKMLGIAVMRERGIATWFPPDYYTKFLGSKDREMLLPLIAYLKANQNASDDAILDSLAFNQHIETITALLSASRLLGDKYDAIAEAKAVIDGFRKMERIWQIVKDSRAAEVCKERRET